MPVILDFHIEPHGKGSYSLEIFERGSSQPLVQTSFDYDVSYVTQFEINQLEPNPRDPQGRMEHLTEFGKKLYDRLFTPDVQKLWADYKQKSDFLVLCVRIAPDAAGLEVLPWETLYDGDEFLAAGPKTGLSAPRSHCYRSGVCRALQQSGMIHHKRDDYKAACAEDRE